jgi:hypothetical protein
VRSGVRNSSNFFNSWTISHEDSNYGDTRKPMAYMRSTLACLHLLKKYSPEKYKEKCWRNTSWSYQPGFETVLCRDVLDRIPYVEERYRQRIREVDAEAKRQEAYWHDQAFILLKEAYDPEYGVDPDTLEDWVSIGSWEKDYYEGKDSIVREHAAIALEFCRWLRAEARALGLKIPKRLPPLPPEKRRRLRR